MFVKSWRHSSYHEWKFSPHYRLYYAVEVTTEWSTRGCKPIFQQLRHVIPYRMICIIYLHTTHCALAARDQLIFLLMRESFDALNASTWIYQSFAVLAFRIIIAFDERLNLFTCHVSTSWERTANLTFINMIITCSFMAYTITLIYLI